MTPIRYRRVISRNASEPRIHAGDVRPLVIIKNAEEFDGLREDGSLDMLFDRSVVKSARCAPKRRKKKNESATDFRCAKIPIKKFLRGKSLQRFFPSAFRTLIILFLGMMKVDGSRAESSWYIVQCLAQIILIFYWANVRGRRRIVLNIR